MTEEIKPRGDDNPAGPAGTDQRPRTVRYNPSDPSSPGPSTRPSEGLRLDPRDLVDEPGAGSGPPASPPHEDSNEAETYLGAPSVASSASEFAGRDLDTQNLGVMLQDRYRLQRVLGKGGFGVVYLAHDRVLDQDVAIKVLRLGAATEGYKKRFIFEARTAAKLRHSAIVNVFDIVQTESGLQLVMEYYPGGTMADLIKREGKIPPKEALGFIRQIALGLAHAHKKGIIHRDIKPANIFFADDEIVKLGDFGICASYESHDHTMTGEIIGTPLYMAPEQQKDSKDVDPRADVYALGMTLYHMIVGRPPRVVNLEDLPPRVRPLLQQVTAYERKERPASCQQLVAMIDQLLKHWDAADDAMRAAATQAIAPDGSRDGESASGTPSVSDALLPGAQGAVSTRTSQPIPPTGSSTWDPAEATQTQMRPATTTTVVHAPSGSWSMVALVGVIIVGFLAVIFMLVDQAGRNGTTTTADSGARPATPPAAIAPPPPAPEIEEDAPIVLIPAEADSEAAEAPGEAEDSEATPMIEESPAAETEIAAAAEPWTPVMPAWALEEEAAPRGIDNFLDDRDAVAATAFIRETFLTLGDWIDGGASPSAAIFRDTAQRRLTQALERYPEEPLFPYLLGRLHENAGNERDAREAFARVRELDGEFFRYFDRTILSFLKGARLDRQASPALRSFLLTPSPLARDAE